MKQFTIISVLALAAFNVGCSYSKENSSSEVMALKAERRTCNYMKPGSLLSVYKADGTPFPADLGAASNEKWGLPTIRENGRDVPKKMLVTFIAQTVEDGTLPLARAATADGRKALIEVVLLQDSSGKNAFVPTSRVCNL